MLPKKPDKLIFNFFENHLDKAGFCLLLILSLLIRLPLFTFISSDMETYLVNWCLYIKENGGFSAFKYKFSDYPPLYLYGLLLIVKLNLPTVFSVKAISVLFDYATAFYVFKIVRLKYVSGGLPYASFFTVLMAPTVIINSSLWGQCDVVYTFFVIASLYYLLKDKNVASFILYGIALSLKLQAIFILPLFFILYLKNKRTSILYFLILPAVYFISILPCLLTGRSLIDLITIYFVQLSSYDLLTLQAASVYQLFPPLKQNLKIFGLSGTLTTIFGVGALCLLILKSNIKMDKDLIIKSALLFVLLTPFLLPRMHERYFYMADVISIIFGFYFTRYFYVTISVILASYFSYLPYLFYDEVGYLLELKYVSLGLLVILIMLLKNYISDLYPKAEIPSDLA